MSERKYPFRLFLIGFIMNVLFRFFWLFIPGLIFTIAGIFVKWCLYAGLGLLILDVVLSFVEQMRIRHTILSESGNEAFRIFQDALFKDGSVFENIQNFAAENAEEYHEIDDLQYAKVTQMVDELKHSITEGMSLLEIVACFEKMCQTPIEDDSILFETGTFNFTGKKLFYFSLVRQFSNSNDEYCQIHVDVLYKPTVKNKAYQQSEWSDCMEESIFDFIRKSPAFACASSDQYVGIDIYWDET